MEAFKPGDYICDECGDEESATVIMMAALEDDARTPARRTQVETTRASESGRIRAAMSE